MSQELPQTDEASRCGGSALKQPIKPLVERLKVMAYGLDSETLREAAAALEAADAEATRRANATWALTCEKMVAAEHERL